jgi:uncharacterized protein
MLLPDQSLLLRVYIGESDRYHGKPLFEAIVEAARETKMAGATVLRSPMGFGASSRVHTEKILRLSEDLPIIIEVVESQERIDEVLPTLDTIIGGGLITMERVRVILYRASPRPR